ncbi:Src substrate cortactin [Schistosoma japonicum]|nr:Src substrate cortactin [Schistosoma japonicum]KAH8857717.1 Src substrate cortactin [Schistosoma japonicum]
MLALKEEVKEADRLAKLKIAPKPSYGYGGKFGVEKDRMDKSAVDWSHIEVTEKHASQRDYAKGFGGKFGVERDRQDKSALGWDHHEKASHHPSQVDYSKGFGGKFGVQTDRVDSSSLGWNDANQTELHPSQMKAPIYKPDGGLSSIRAQFEQSNQSNTLRNPSGPSLAQQRVREEQARWEAERKQREHEVEQSREKSTSDTTKSSPKSPVSISTTELSNSTNNNYNYSNLNKQTDPQTDANSFNSTVSSNSSTFAESNRFSEHEQRNSSGSHVHNNPGASYEQAPKMYTAIAMYDYEAAEDDELTFSVGEKIIEIEKIDEGWWKGVCRNKIGLFPANYVTLL